MLFRRFVPLALAIVAHAAARPAHAHAQLQQATPAVGGGVAASPRDLRLRFSECIEPRFSTAAFTSEAGTAIPLDRPTADPADARIVIVKMGRTLPPATYMVPWHVVSVDTHKT